MYVLPEISYLHVLSLIAVGPLIFFSMLSLQKQSKDDREKSWHLAGSTLALLYN